MKDNNNNSQNSVMVLTEKNLQKSARRISKDMYIQIRLNNYTNVWMRNETFVDLVMSSKFMDPKTSKNLYMS